jgi:hypothetical protein
VIVAKKFNIKNTDLHRKVQEYVLADSWPFESVSAKDFIKASSLLLEMQYNMASRKIDNKKVSPEAYMDRTFEATAQMLKCIHKMELETSSNEMNAMLHWHKGKVYDMSFLDAQEFVDYALSEMYSCNNTVCDYLAPELMSRGIYPRYIDTENERTWFLDEECLFAKKAAQEHVAAMTEAYAEIDNLIKYGLPGTGAVGRFVDKVSGREDEKQHNQTIVDKILSSEADLEIVTLYILPELDLRIREYEAKAIIEEANAKKKEELGVGELMQSDPYYFRNGYITYLKAKEVIEEALLVMQKKELKLESDYKIKIERDEKSGTYVLTAQWARGEKTEEKSSKQLTDKISRKSTVVKEKNRKEKSIRIQIGQSSKRLYEETRRKSACKLGYMNRQEVGTKERRLANIFSAYSMRREAMIRRRTRVAGRKNYRAQVSFDAAKVEDKVVYESQKEGKEKKEKTIVRVTVGAGNASANINTDKVVPVVQGSASLASASAEALEIAKASASLGAASYSSDPGIEEKVKDAVKEVIGNAISGEEQKSIEDTVQEIADSAADKMTSVSTSGPNASARIQVADQTLLSASCDENGSKTENKIPVILDEVESFLGEATQITANGEEEATTVSDQENEFDCVAVLDDAIDMQFFDIDPSRLIPINHHEQTEPQPVCVDYNDSERSRA